MKLVLLIISAVLIFGDVKGQGPVPTTFPPGGGPEQRPNPNHQPGQVDLLNNNVLNNSSMIVDLIINIIMNGGEESRTNVTTLIPIPTWTSELITTWTPVWTTTWSPTRFTPNFNTTLRPTVDGAPTGTTPNFDTTPRTTMQNTPFPLSTAIPN